MSEVLVRFRKIAATNYLNLSFGLASKSSYSKGSFLLLNNIFRKKMKKTNFQKFVIVCALPETEYHIYSIQVNFPTPYHLKTSENL